MCNKSQKCVKCGEIFSSIKFYSCYGYTYLSLCPKSGHWFWWNLENCLVYPFTSVESADYYRNVIVCDTFPITVTNWRTKSSVGLREIRDRHSLGYVTSVYTHTFGLCGTNHVVSLRMTKHFGKQRWICWNNRNALHLYLGVEVLSLYLRQATGYPERNFVFFKPSRPSRHIPRLYIHWAMIDSFQILSSSSYQSSYHSKQYRLSYWQHRKINHTKIGKSLPKVPQYYSVLHYQDRALLSAILLFGSMHLWSVIGFSVTSLFSI
jgi:hypothetical protein